MDDTIREALAELLVELVPASGSPIGIHIRHSKLMQRRHERSRS